MQDYQDRLRDAMHVFTPGAPVSRKDCFSGRKEQITRIIDAIPAPGRHPVLFGQRGVGKTSLANILHECILNVLPVKTSCDGSDTFETIWDRLVSSTSLEFRTKAWGLSPEQVLRKTTLAQFLGRDPKGVTPSQISDVLKDVGSHWVLFILDEFDKVTSAQAKRDMAALIKNLSDNNRWVTIALVGVGTSIGELIGHHPSIERNLVQIELPTMNDEEIQSIVANGCAQLGINVDQDVLREVAILSNGFPHYAHLLGLHAVRVCLKEKKTSLDVPTFRAGCTFAVADAIEKYRDAFARATRTSKLSRYPRILCACAAAVHDERGVFTAGNVADAMWSEFKEDVSIPAVVPALGEFCRAERGAVLTKVPVGKRNLYEFSEPMMRPFLRIKARTLQQTS